MTIVNGGYRQTLTKEQLRRLCKYIITAIETNGKEVRTYRGLIYGILEFEDYYDGMDLGLLDLNNCLAELDEAVDIAKNINRDKTKMKWSKEFQEFLDDYVKEAVRKAVADVVEPLKIDDYMVLDLRIKVSLDRAKKYL